MEKAEWQEPVWEFGVANPHQPQAAAIEGMGEAKGFNTRVRLGNFFHQLHRSCAANTQEGATNQSQMVVSSQLPSQIPHENETKYLRMV